MAETSALQGPERIEFWDVVGRPFRQGSPRDLETGDAERVREALVAGDGERARAYLAYMHPGYCMVVAGYVEWVLGWPAALADGRSAEEAAKAVAEAHAAWLAESSQHIEGEALDLVTECFGPERMTRAVADAARSSGSVAEQVLAEPVRRFARVLAAVEGGALEEARREFLQYHRAFRERHDLFSRLVWALGGAACRRFGQAAAEQAQAASFSSCSFYEPMWAPVGKLRPDEQAVALAEHLRGHFSGPGRHGAVAIVEEEDRFRIVLDPCGSGGAMRREALEKGTPGLGVLPEATPLTWGRTGEVPAYCSHCALNELESIRRVGYPAWVTEFEPDPMKPCGWTVYKDPARIPEAFFERLGERKDSARFRPC